MTIHIKTVVGNISAVTSRGGVQSHV
jgi:hypothetical protein